MPRNTYFYENIIFTNILRCSIVWGGKGKDRVVLTKSLIYERIGRVAVGKSFKWFGR